MVLASRKSHLRKLCDEIAPLAEAGDTEEGDMPRSDLDVPDEATVGSILERCSQSGRGLALGSL